MEITAEGLLKTIPEALRRELIDEYNKIVKNFREGRWEPAELDGGRLCEIVHSILNGLVSGRMPSKANKPDNMYDACKALEKADQKVFPRSVRVQIPRLLIALYEIRNNRGVGHVGGDVQPNHMDSSLVLSTSKWLLSELVRLFHQVDTQVAAKAIDAITERELPLVWKASNNKLRILDPNLVKKDQVLLFLYHSANELSEAELVDWSEHSNPSVFRRDILRKLHNSRLIEYDEETGKSEISPAGIKDVEKRLLVKTI